MPAPPLSTRFMLAFPERGGGGAGREKEREREERERERGREGGRVSLF